ncbi:MAG: tRNA uridine-5-carboxymethylaminomethyl(34) synthesis GTPase MnmE, partial [Deltaproteobacteria bacterium]|nr:tRNA uridine-5-carboxymethylaminomethyl(34) synthesis GTPase MnmE [Deltaproteobacteria bacterium]
SVVLTDLRQRDAANRTLLALDRFLNLAAESASLELMSFELRDALLQLGEITGESASADVLDLIFSKFCVGK